MSICPNTDGYSVYLDGEIPRDYEKKYEEHLDECSSCKEQYNRFQSIQNVLREDAQNIDLTEAECDESFARLQQLAKFRQNVDAAKKDSTFESIKRSLPAIAAALIIGISIPLQFRQAEPDAFTPTLHTMSPTAKLITNKGVIAENSLSDDFLREPFFTDRRTANQPPTRLMTTKGVIAESSLSGALQNASYNTHEPYDTNTVRSVDVFRPTTLNDSNNLKINFFENSDFVKKSNVDVIDTSNHLKGSYYP